MNTVVLGVDQTGHHEAALRLLTRLRPQDAVIDVFHVFEMPTVFGDVTLPISIQLMAEAIEDEKTKGRELCEMVAQRLQEMRRAARTPQSVGGYPAAEIMEYADRVEARLIAVGGTHKGALRAILTGSVARALVIAAHQSVLVARGEPAADGPIRAVFATDHSSFADRCLQELLALAPRGISHLTVLTCYPRDFVQAIRPRFPEFVLDPCEWIESNLRERNEQVKANLAPLGCEIETRVFPGTAAIGIPRVMKETGADLLILGAQGHGFVDRVKLGSTSYQQVMAESYPVLVLRVRPQTARLPERGRVR